MACLLRYPCATGVRLSLFHGGNVLAQNWEIMMGERERERERERGRERENTFFLNAFLATEFISFLVCLFPFIFFNNKAKLAD